MREIKLRAYDKEEQKFIYAEPIYGFFPSVGGLTRPEHDSVEDKDAYGEMQKYLGFRDKNKKEIYEGDIVKHEWYNDKKPFVMTCDPYDFHQLIESGVSCDDSFEGEVIGNIDENPELLES